MFAEGLLTEAMRVTHRRSFLCSPKVFLVFAEGLLTEAMRVTHRRSFLCSPKVFYHLFAEGLLTEAGLLCSPKVS